MNEPVWRSPTYLVITDPPESPIRTARYFTGGSLYELERFCERSCSGRDLTFVRLEELV